MFITIVQIAIGGAIGSVLRYLTLLVVSAPFGTLIVNVLGSLIMGAFFVILSSRLHPLLMTGILGGFTTFSAFSLDALKLWQGGQFVPSLVYVAASVILSLIAVAIGAALARGALA